MAQTRGRAQGATIITRADELGVSSSNQGAPPDLAAPDPHADFPVSFGNRPVPRVWRPRPRRSSLQTFTLRVELGQLDTRNHFRALGVAPACHFRLVRRAAAPGRRRRSQGALETTDQLLQAACARGGRFRGTGRHVGGGRAATGSGRDWLPRPRASHG